MKTPELTKRVKAIKNLSDFARVSKIPRRTLDRIKAGQHEPTMTTRLALASALKDYKPTESK